jgi:trimeric autotransporter adhesin
MTIQHSKTLTVPDWAGVVTVFNSQGATTTMNASDAVRPSDWNSGLVEMRSLLGNTVGVGSVSGSNIVMSAGPNVTLSGVQGAGAATVGFSAPTPVAQSNQSMGLYGSSQTIGQSSSSTVDARSLSIIAQGALSLGLSAGALLMSVPVPAAQSYEPMAFSAGGASTTANTLQFGNTQGVSFQLSNGSVVGSVKTDYLTTAMASNASTSMAGTGFTSTTTAGTALVGTLNSQGLSVGMPAVITNAITTARASNDALGLNSALTANGVSVTANSSGLSLNFPSFDYASNTTKYAGTGTSATNATITLNSNGLAISVAAPGGGGGIAASLSGNSTSGGAGYSNVTSGTLVLAGGNNITLSQDGSRVTISGANVGGAQTGISSLAVGGTTYTSGSVQFVNSYNVSFNSTTGQGLVASASYPAATSLSFSNLNGVTFGLNASTLTASVNSTSGVGQGTTFAGANVSGSMTLNTQGANLSLSVAAPAATTMAIYGLGNTAGAQSSSSTINEQTLSVSAMGNISAGMSAGALMLSVSTAAQTVQPVAFSAGAASSAFSTLQFQDSNGLSFSNNAGSVRMSHGLEYASHTTVFAGTGTTVNVQNVGASATLNSQGLQLSVTAPAETGAAISIGGNSTSGAGGYSNISTGTAFLMGGNNITLSQSGNSITISGPNAGGAQTGISGLVVSNTTYTSGTVSFSNANGITFGSSAGQAITASYNSTSGAGQGTTFGGTNVSGSMTLNSNGLALSLSAPAVGGAQTGISSIAVGGTTYTSGSVQFVNSYNVSFSSTTGQGLVASASYPAQTAQPVAFSAGAASSLFSTLSLQDSNGVSWSNNAGAIRVTHDLQYTSATSAITAAAFPSASTTKFAGSGTTTQAANAGVSITLNSNGLNISVTAPAQSVQPVAFSAGGASSAFSTLQFQDSNGISFSNNAGSVRLTHGLQYTSNTSAITGAAAGQGTTFAGANLSGSMTLNTAGLNLSMSAAPAAITTMALYASGAQTVGAASSTTIAEQSLSISGAGNVSVGFNAGVLLISATGAGGGGIGQINAGTTNASSGTVTFGSSAGNVTFGMNAGYVTASAPSGGGGVAIAASNTTFTSGTVVMSASGGAITINSGAQSVGFSVPATSSLSATGNASISSNASTISIGANAAAISLSAGGNSTSGAGGYSNVSSGTLLLAGGNNITLSQAGASLTISGANEMPVGISTQGNTAGSTGLMTGQYVLVGGNNITLSQSTVAGQSATLSIIGGAGGGGIGAISAPGGSATSGTVSFANANGVTFGMNGQTLTASVSPGGAGGTAMYFEPEIAGVSTGLSCVQTYLNFRPFYLGANVSAARLQMLAALTSQSVSTYTITFAVSNLIQTSGSGTGETRFTIGLFSRLSTGTNANSASIVSFDSTTASMGYTISQTQTQGSNASTASVGLTVSQTIQFPSLIGTDGGVTYGTVTATGSSSTTQTTTGASTFSSTQTASLANAAMSGTRAINFGLGTSLSPGEYWLMWQVSTGVASNSTRLDRIVAMSTVSLIAAAFNQANFNEIGNSTGAISTSGARQGNGYFTISNQSTTTVALGAISNHSSNASVWFNLSGYGK